MNQLRMLSNPLGDVRAEADHEMLSQAFYETPDYLTLLDTDEKIVIVGRRGTGKSALTFKLLSQWGNAKANSTILIAPDEHHTLAIRAGLSRLGSSFLQVKASVRLLWKYGLLLEVAQAVSTKYKLKDAVAASAFLLSHLHLWGRIQERSATKMNW